MEFLNSGLLFIGYNIPVLRISNNSDYSTAAPFGKQLPKGVDLVMLTLKDVCGYLTK